MKTIHFFCFFFLAANAFGNSDRKVNKELNLVQELSNAWVSNTLELTKQTPGYSAPVAARTFCYISIGMYEACVEFFPKNQSLRGQLVDWNRKTWQTNDEQLSCAMILNELNFILTNYFFVNMPPSSKEKSKNLYQNWKQKLEKRKHSKLRENSFQYAEELAAEIILWSKMDGADQCWNKNFPKDFKEKMCEGCWTKTLPGFESALQPYWGKNRALVRSNIEQCADLRPLTFSTDTSSLFYLENLKLTQFYDTLKLEHKNIAKYWDDSPGVSGTPVGHLYAIALQSAREKRLPVEQKLEMFVSLGIALNDAVIESWRLKYEFSVIRPISYIQQYIEPKFNTAIPTPPFPEFPSGHSFQSGAGSEILKHFLGDSTSFIDRTNIDRIDIKGSARSFQNFTEMSEEMSLSRFYGGIHYDHTLTKSLIFGRKIGRNTIVQLQFHKDEN